MTTATIVVGYDGSDDARRAVRWALDEAGRAGAAVHLVHAFEWFPGPGWMLPGPATWPDTDARADAENVAREAAQSATRSHPAVPTTWSVPDGPSTWCLLEAAKGASLIVVGSRGTGGFGELLVGSTAVGVSTHAHCPVVVVRGGAADPGAPVIAGVDGSPSSQLALGFAFDQAAARGAALRVVSAWLPPADRYRVAGMDVAEATAELKRSVNQLLDGWRGRYPDLPVTTDLPAQSPARALIDASRAGQLVVVGSRGYGELRGKLLGSVSQQLIHHSHSPVAVVREMGSAGDAERR